MSGDAPLTEPTDEELAALTYPHAVLFDAASILLQRHEYHDGGSWASQGESWYRQLMIVVRLISYETSLLTAEDDKPPTRTPDGNQTIQEVPEDVLTIEQL